MDSGIESLLIDSLKLSFERAPAIPESIMYLARYMRQRGDRDAAGRLLSSLFDEEHKRGHLSGSN